MFLRFLVLLCLAAQPAIAGGRGGHNTTFNPNSYGGNWKNIINDYGGCNSAGIAQWLTYGISRGAAPANLYIPPGTICTFTSPNGFIWDGTLGGPGVQNATIWAYGVTANSAAMLAEGFYQDNLHSARIQTVSAGSIAVTVIDGNVGRFAPNDLICIDGIELQTSGFPPNFQFFEFRLIVAINGNVITLSAPLTNSYKSTWPLISAGDSSHVDLAGPATVHLMAPSWNTNSRIFGLTVQGPSGVNSSGRNIAHYDVSFHGTGVAPSTSDNMWYFYSWLGTQVEVDKEISNLWFVRTAAVQIEYQSASVYNSTLDNVTLSGALNGTGYNNLIRGSMLNPIVFIGPTQFGHGNVINFESTIVPTGVTPDFPNGSSPAIIRVDPSIFSYSNGVFSIAVASAASVWQWAVPGQKYFFAKSDNTQCSTPTTFTITDLAIVSTTLNITTSLVGALPTPCSGGAASWYVGYPAATITQKFSGPADLTQFAAPP